jgi:hypothetical protein
MSVVRCRQFFYVALLAAALGLPATQAVADPIERQEDSVQGAIDGFISYLKSETNEALTAAARLARENHSLAAARSYLESLQSQFDRWQGSLSDQKAGVGTLSKDATEMWEAWRATAASSWATIQRQAENALNWIETWMHNRSFSEPPGTPV